MTNTSVKITGVPLERMPLAIWQVVAILCVLHTVQYPAGISSHPMADSKLHLESKMDCSSSNSCEDAQPSRVEVTNFHTFNGKRVMAVQPHLRTCTIPRPKETRLTLNEVVSKELFNLNTSPSKSLQQQAVTIAEIESISSSVREASHSRYWGPVCYIKHRNLDVKPLTFIERFRLARIHYFSVANAIRLTLILFFLWWFLYNAATILSDFEEHNNMIYLDFMPPNKSRPPAITICTHCVLCS